MRLPTRKSEQQKYALRKGGPIHLTAAGIQEMKDEMKQIERKIPHVREELIITREMGDLSENAGYQIAKATLRRLQNRLLSLQERMKRVVEIKPSDSDTVQLGSRVTVEVDGTKQTFHIVGPTESSPGKGRISMISPLGKVLMNKKSGDVAELKRGGEITSYTIQKIK